MKIWVISIFIMLHFPPSKVKVVLGFWYILPLAKNLFRLLGVSSEILKDKFRKQEFEKKIHFLRHGYT